ncbi:MAG: STAS/SEC14 domain-containing protein [Alphaproteobacteria bacterium]|nr:STAS/SEC14 domain-containing protein [Alphaproteobacteria bacterium]MDE2336186.1 STAS/SEC14 domain-containing protein [Alphaproteobacteria bacterium]
MVTDVAWLRAATHVFSPFFPGTIKVFDLADYEAARKWISEDGPRKGEGKAPRRAKRRIIYNIKDMAEEGRGKKRPARRGGRTRV